MSNMQQYGGGKNPPWARNNKNQQMNPLQQQPMMNQSPMSQPNPMMQYQQVQPVFQGGIMQQKTNMALMQQNTMTLNQTLATQINQSPQMFPQTGVVAYPAPRPLNHNTFCSSPAINQTPPQVQNSSSPKQRVFAGTVTKTHDEFGFVDEDVFFQTNACVKGSQPVVGDRVLVEASYNPNMPFKWNATRIQVLPSNKPPTPSRRESMPKNKGFNSVNNSGSNANNYASGMVINDNQNGNYGNNQRSRDRKTLSPRREDRIRSRDLANRSV